MLIRTARELDRPHLRDLDRRAWSLISNPILPDGRMWMNPDTELSEVLVAEREGELAGYVQVARAMPVHLTTASHAGRIASIAVSPEHRGHGVAAKLLEAAEGLGRKRHFKKLVLQVLGTNVRAQRVYERAGFVCEGRLTGLFYINGAYVDDLWYGKWIAAGVPPTVSNR